MIPAPIDTKQYWIPITHMPENHLSVLEESHLIDTLYFLFQLFDWTVRLLKYTASINDIEKLTGSEFFPGLPYPFSASFKSSLPSQLWPSASLVWLTNWLINWVDTTLENILFHDFFHDFFKEIRLTTIEDANFNSQKINEILHSHTL